MSAALAAAAIAAGAPMRLVALGWCALAWPLPGLAAFAAWAGWGWWRRRRRRPGPDDEAAFLQTLGSELGAGASLRTALGSAAARTDRLDVAHAGRAAAAGLPAERVARLLGEALPVNGRMAAAAWLLASESGGPAAGVIHALALRAAREGELVRERHSLTAQARASAWVVAGIPLLLVGGTVLSGRIDAGGDPALGAVLAVGLVLQGAGVAVVVAMLRGAR